MFHLLMVLLLLGAVTASENMEAEESVPPIKVYGLDEVHSHQYDGHHKHRPHDVYLHGVKGYKAQSNVDRIVSELFNPDYIEPITVLDYRYVKTGGRDYTRGAGGQILILPKNVRTNQKKEFHNYDELLEFLRLQQLAEIKAHHREMNQLGYEHRQYGPHEHHVEITGRNQYENSRNQYENSRNQYEYSRNQYEHSRDQYEHSHKYHNLHDVHNHHDHQDYGQQRLGIYGGYKRDAAEPAASEPAAAEPAPANKEETAA